MSELLLRLLIACSALSLAVALGFSLRNRERGRGNKKIVLPWLAGEGIALVLVVNNFLVNEGIPFVSMYQLLTFGSLLFGGVYLYLWRFRDGGWTAPYFIACSLAVSLGLCFMEPAAVWHFPPALRSPWFLPHILVYVIAYILSAVSFVMMAVKLFSKSVEARSRLDGGIYDCVSVLFSCMTMGMLFGALWANEVWGDFWGWDIKECWSLVCWLTYLTWLHLRRSGKFRKIGDVFILLGFIFVLVTFFFVNGMAGADGSLHTYN